MSLKDAIQLVVLSMIWGSSFLLIKIAVTAMPPIWVSWGRIALGVLFLLATVGFLRLWNKENRDLLRSKWQWLVFIGLINNAIPWTLYAYGGQQVSSSVSAILNATTPLWGALLGWFLPDSQMNWRKGAALLLGFAGVVLAVIGSGVRLDSDITAVLMISLAPVLYAISTTLAKRVLAGVPPLLQASGQLATAALWLLPLLLLSPNSKTITVGPILALLALGVIGSGVAYWIYFNLLASVSPTQVMAVTYLIPIWALFWGIIDREPVGWLSFLGVAVIIAGVVLLNSKAAAPVAENAHV
jgi:drug/metabolite transporter (DMT)-like permease